MSAVTSRDDTLPSGGSALPGRSAAILDPAARQPLTGLLPAALLVALWLVSIPASGGYFPRTWYPSTIGVVILLVITLGTGAHKLPHRPAARVALLGFGSLVAANYLSILWANSPEIALDASNKLLFYLASAWIMAVLPWTPRRLAALIGAWSLGIGVVCAVDLARAVMSVKLDPFFVELRYADPMQYPNATAALAVMGMWPAAILSSHRGLPSWLRAIFLSCAAFLAAFALLPQSRGAVVGLILSALIALALAPYRGRLLIRLIVLGAGIAWLLPRLLAVGDAGQVGSHISPALRHAALGLLIVSAVAAAIGAVLPLAEKRIESRVARRRRAGIPAGSGSPLGLGGRRGKTVAAVLVVALAGGVAASASPVTQVVRNVWQGAGGGAGARTPHLLLTSPEERADYLRVALEMFRQAPILGAGAGSFGPRYDALRQREKHSKYAHDLAARVLSETGAVGLGLVCATILALGVGAVRTGRRNGGLARSCAAASLTLAAYFLVHDSLDWLDEFPTLAAPALGFLLAVAQMRDPERPAAKSGDTALAGVTAPRRARAVRLARAPVLVGLAAAVGAGLVAPWLGQRYVARAFATFRVDPPGAFSDLDAARALIPFSVEPLNSEGTISLALGQQARARAAFAAAVRREDDWYGWFELALVDGQRRAFARAGAEIATAVKLDANDPVLTQARTAIEHRLPIDPARYNQLTVRGPQAEFFRPENLR